MIIFNDLMIIEHLAILHFENEVDIPDRITHCQMGIYKRIIW